MGRLQEMSRRGSMRQPNNALQTAGASPTDRSNGSAVDRPLRVLAVGDADHPEFGDVNQLLQKSKVANLVTLQQRTRCLYELALVFQSRPGAVDLAEAEQLRQRNLLAGMVVVLGSYCEGETRTGAPLPHCERLFWYQFPPWWRNVEAAWQAGRPASWQQPFGASLPVRMKSTEFAWIESPDADAAEAIVDACASLGVAAVWTQRGGPRPCSTPAGVGIWVGGQLSPSEEGDLDDFRRSLPPDARLIVLLDFPRRDRVRRARELGATSVLGKPWRVEQLAALLGAEPVG